MTIPSRPASALVGALFLMTAFGCGGGSSSSASGGGTPPPPPSGSGLMALHLTQNPSDGWYRALRVGVQKVEVHGAAGWVPVATAARTVDLMAGPASLAAGTALPAGRYDRVRVSFAPTHDAVMADGTDQPLALPEALKPGVEVPMAVDVADKATTDLWLILDAAAAVQKVPDSTAPKLFFPYLRAVDKGASGSISGELHHAGTNPDGTPHNHPMYDAMIYAETLDPDGTAHVVRAARADHVLGTYTLDLLPLDTPVHVVCMPMEVDHSHTPIASDPFTLSAASPTAKWDQWGFWTEYTATLAVNAVPVVAAGQSDVVCVLKTIATETQKVPHDFVVRYAANGRQNSEERVDFRYVDVGPLKVRSERTTWKPDGTAELRAVTLETSLDVNKTNYFLVRQE